MDVKFCPSCNSLLEKAIIRDVLMFRCNKNCSSEYPATDEDVLMDRGRGESTAEDIRSFHVLLRNASKDPTNPRDNIECPKCKFTPVAYVRLSGSLHKVYTCAKCKHVWT